MEADQLAARRRRRAHVLDLDAAEVVLAVELLDLLDDHPDLVHSATPDGRFLFANHAWLETLGYERSDLPHLTLLDVVAPSHHDGLVRDIALALDGEALPRARWRLLAREGHAVDVEGATVLHFMNGLPVGTITIMRPLAAAVAEGEGLETTGP